MLAKTGLNRNLLENIRKLFEESVDVKREILELRRYEILEKMALEIALAIESGNKLMLCGNGGSAADAQHLAAEMLVRLRPHNNREGIPAMVLAQDTSTITACGNDFSYDHLYERMVQSFGKKGDVLIGISTSGNSKNVLLAMQKAKSLGIKVFGFLGGDGGQAAALCDEVFTVPSDKTGRVQESHITAGHALLECVEDMLVEHQYISLQR